ncbi:hypothetical protein CHUAL_009514 [Chamberlinius hualienensis]
MLDDLSGLLTNCVDVVSRPISRKKQYHVESNVDRGEKSKTERNFGKRKANEDDSTIQMKRNFQENGDKDKTTTHEAFISSLFKKNPQIPHVQQKAVVQVVEKVFSSSKFEDLNVHPFIVSNLRQSFHIDRLTAVQEQTIPHILNGTDVLVKSQTGSGKTLAYVIPIVHKLQEIEPAIYRASGLNVVVVLPTRELALQTFECFQKLLRPFTRIVSCCFMGGQRKKSEKASLRKGINILISTPQRLIDHLQNSKQLTFSQLKYLVLDEADRLMEMGYEKDVATIVEEINKQRGNCDDQLLTVLLSATLTTGVQKLAGLSMRKPVTVDVSSDERGLKQLIVTPSNLKHHFIIVPAKLKLVTLFTFILWKCRADEHKMLVFLPTQDLVDYFTKLCSYVNKVRNPHDTGDAIHITQLHGNMSQQTRNEVFKNMRNANCGVLLCTDVCARGLDLPKVDWIVQLNGPASVAEYVHRVGRTARIGSSGDALLFLLPSEVQYVNLLETYKIKMNQMTLDEVLEALPNINQQLNGKKLVGVEEAATELQLDCERHVESDPVMRELGVRAFQSAVRAYATYPNHIRHVFDFKLLHLGHVAKGLAIRQTPSELGLKRIGGQSGGTKPHNFNINQSKKKVKEINWKAKMLDEYGSGL